MDTQTDELYIKILNAGYNNADITSAVEDFRTYTIISKFKVRKIH